LFFCFSNFQKHYERSAIDHALAYFEDVYYKASIAKLQDKVRSSKPDEKLRDQLLAMIEKDNQIIIDLMKNVRKDYNARLEPYCIQYQV
jgi:hypothetical protein